MIFGQDRTELRQAFAEAWRRHRDGLPREPLQDQIAAVIALHPEYHAVVEDPAALDRDWTPAQGDTNPYLHMALHLALRDMVATDRPTGMTARHAAACAACGDGHDAEHLLIECLAETLWEAQRAGRPPDEGALLGKVDAALRRRR